MGNIYLTQEKYSAAIKMYRMVYDWLPPTSKEMRFKILKNIGQAFFKEGKFEVSTDSKNMHIFRNILSSFEK